MEATEARRYLVLIFTALFTALLLAALPVLAQESTVTEDEVNAVARQLYCPVCENIPLDVCGTPACIQWRGEIRSQLEAGETPETIVADFVRRFGDRVVGTPQDPTLRALALVTPWIVAAMVLAAGIEVLRRRRGRAQAPLAGTAESAATKDDDYYRARLEADLRTRR